jgi:hypothetical protein
MTEVVGSGSGPVGVTERAVAGPAVVAVPGRIAARIDRLPLTPVHWELALLTQVAWGLIVVDTDGIAGRLYPFAGLRSTC